MKQIALTQGQIAIVDDADYEWLNRYKWFAHKGHNNIWYAERGEWVNGKRRTITMHRFILALKDGDPREGDHKNHKGLDNQRCNLRICTPAQNQHNRLPQRNKSSVFKGVHLVNRYYKDKIYKYWLSVIRLEGHGIHLGNFDTEIEAAKAYDLKAIELFGEYAHTNF